MLHYENKEKLETLQKPSQNFTRKKFEFTRNSQKYCQKKVVIL